jgi:endonuclease G
MTNVAPQRPSLNRGPWREMEQRISDLWTQKYGEMWVIVGSLASTSQSSRESLPGTSVNVPEKYYMIVAGQGPDGVRALAVLLDQSAGRWDFPVHNIVTVSELEKLSGLEFFPDMPKFLKTPLKLDRPTRLWPVRLQDIFKLIMIRFV